jgi:hypothetical protein
MRSRYLIACSILTAVALAQSDRGTITGTVSDPAGAVVPGAVVSVRNTESGVQHETVTTATGNYTVAQLPAGMYELSVELAGFNKFIQQGIRVFVAQTARIDVSLRLGGTTESVTVQADAALLKTESAVQSETVTREKLNELPLNFGARGNNAAASIRNPYSFVTLVPGGNISSYSSIKLNGAPLNTMQIRVEGHEANNQRIAIRQDQVQPSVESLEEMSVQTSNFAAEYGQVAGGMFNLTVKSGTNAFHGSAFEYFVNESLGAGIPYTNNGAAGLVRPRNRRHNFGGSIGGPVWVPKVYDGHNRTFFFFALEKFHQGQTVGGRLATMPTDAMRSGDFSQALTGRALTSQLDPLGRPILENVIYDPATTRVVNGARVRDPFPGNIIQPSQLDPVALKLQALIPTATRPGLINNWDQAYDADTDKNIASVKIDHNFTSLGKISIYYSRYWGPHFNGSDGLPVPITATRRIPTSTHTVRVNYHVPISPRLLLSAGAGYLRHYNPDLGLPEVIEYDIVGQTGLKGALFGRGFPVIGSMFSATGGGMSLAQARTGAIPSSDKPSAVLSATYVHNNHTYKAGGEWRVDGYTERSLGASTGNYSFAAAQTGLPSTQGQALQGGNVGLPYASFLLGLVNTATISNPNDPQWRKPTVSLYIQDNWKVTRKLTLDYGIRWDHQGHPVEIRRRTSMFAPTVANPSAGGLAGASIYEGDGPGRCNCRFAETYPYAIGPRLGVAYQITPKTVLRAGWGLTYAQTQANTAGGTLGAGGWNSISFNTPAFGEPSALLRNGLTYNLADLYRETHDPGVRPSPGLIDNPSPLVDPNAGRPPRLNQWSISLQREITRNLVVEAAYVGIRSAWYSASNLIDLNALTPERLATFGLDVTRPQDQQLLRARIDSPLAAQRGFNRLPYAGYSAANTVAQSLRPFPQFGNVGVQAAPLGNRWYDSLQMKVTKRYSHGLDLLGTFTWQQELTTDGPVNDVFNRRNQKAISGDSEPFILVLAFNYRVPALGPNRWVRTAIGGWTFGGILRYASGRPIPVPSSQNQLNSLLFRGTRMNRVPGEPLFLQDLNCRCFDPNQDFVLNPKAWADPAQGQWGFSAPYYNDYRYQRRPDEQLTIGRIFRIKEGVSLQVRAEFFNALNRTYMNDPAAGNPLQTQSRNAQGVPISGFGRIDTGSVINPPRNGQLVARLQW